MIESSTESSSPFVYCSVKVLKKGGIKNEVKQEEVGGGEEAGG